MIRITVREIVGTPPQSWTLKPQSLCAISRMQLREILEGGRYACHVCGIKPGRTLGLVGPEERRQWRWTCELHSLPDTSDDMLLSAGFSV